MKVIKLNSQIERDLILQQIGSTTAGNKILKDKMQTKLFFLKGIKTPAANILKQDALSIGADLAVPKNTILCADEKIDALLIANDKQIKILSKKELAQPFGLKEFASELNKYKKVNEFSREIMGVLNINEDSFYEGSRFIAKNTLAKIENMIEEGADIIDIGALSSRPGSKKISAKEELGRIKRVIDEIYKNSLYKKIVFSIDSYEPIVVEYALNCGFSIINDITGLDNDEVCKIASRYKAKVVIMHMKGTPEDMQKNPHYENVILEVEGFFKERIQKAKKFGIEDIILDVGIGFGKTLDHNLMLISHLSHFKKFNLPLLVGASRKSMIDKIIPCDVKDRLSGTLALHLKAESEGASMIRCHDVKEHIQAFKVADALKATTV